MNILQLIQTIDLVIFDYYFQAEDIINIVKEFFFNINNLRYDQQERRILQELEKIMGSEKMKKTVREIISLKKR